MVNLVNYINGLKQSFFVNQYPSKTELDILLGYGLNVTVNWIDQNDKYLKRGNVTANLLVNNNIVYTGVLNSENNWSRSFNNIPYDNYIPNLTFTNSSYYTSTMSVNGSDIIFTETLKTGTIKLRFYVNILTELEDVTTIFHESYNNNTPIALGIFCGFDSFPYTAYDNYSINELDSNSFLLEYTFANRIIGRYNNLLAEVYNIIDINDDGLEFYWYNGVEEYNEVGDLQLNDILILNQYIDYSDTEYEDEEEWG